MGENSKGYYRDGTPISEHPSKQEIQEHLDEYLELIQAIGDKEQHDVIEEMRNTQINTHFMRLCKKLTDEQVIDKAIYTWAEQWPWEVKPFFGHINTIKARLYDPKGFAVGDKDRSMLLYGCVPDKIKTLCLAHRQNFWQRDRYGKCKNLETFYRLCPKAKISTLRGSA